MKVKDIPLTEFIHQFAMEITDLNTLKYALLLADGYDRNQAQQKVFKGNLLDIQRAETDLFFMEFMQ